MSKMSDAILKILRESEGHMTADQVYSECQNRGIGSSVASVYRNLGVLVDQGLVSRLKMADMPDFFDKTTSPHSHNICIKCGKVSDAALGDLAPLLKEHSGLEVVRYNLQIFHICESCRE